MRFCAVTHSTYLLNKMLVSLFTVHSLHISQGVALRALMGSLASHYNCSIWNIHWTKHLSAGVGGYT